MNNIKILNIDLSPLAPINDMGILKSHILSSINNECKYYVNLSGNQEYGIDSCKLEYRYSFFNLKKCIIKYPTANAKKNSLKSKNKVNYINNFINTKLKAFIHLLKLLITIFDKTLIKFVNENNPKYIISFPVTFFEIFVLLKIYNKTNSRIIIYITDDIINHIYSSSILRFIFCRLQKYSLKKITSISYINYSISYSLSSYYSSLFGTQFITLMDGVDQYKYHLSRKKYQKPLHKDEFIIRYIGHAEPDRIENLLLISEVVEELNNSAYNIIFEIYIFKYEILKYKDYFKDFKHVKIMDTVAYDSTIILQCSSDILIHTESFKKHIINRYLKYTVSTKIAQYNSSGVKILAFGPENIESMNILKMSNSAKFVHIYSKNKVQEAIINLLNTSDRINSNGIRFALKYQNLDNLTRIFINNLHV